MMNDFLKITYDGTFEGFLCAINRIEEQNLNPCEIIKRSEYIPGLFDQIINITTRERECNETWQKLIKKTSLKNAGMIQAAFLNSNPKKELILMHYFQKVLKDASCQIYQNRLVRNIDETFLMARTVYREAHRFLGFVRFQNTKDNFWFAPIKPEHDIVKLISKHFMSRFPEQKWIIYDTSRKYGIYFNIKSLAVVKMENPLFSLENGKIEQSAMNMDEEKYREFWKSYYEAVNIPERENKRQMIQSMPKKYWNYLPEKQ